jgi:glycosyltransferase involved in cell wall biosynthesis
MPKASPMSVERITILVASYNASRYLRTSIGSVLAQTSDRWDLLIVDDGSTDDSERVYAEYRSHPRIRIEKNEKNLGVVRTQRRLVELAETDLVGVLDADDALAPECIERVLAAYERHPSAGFVYTNFWYCDGELKRERLGFSRAIPRGKSSLDRDAVSHFKSFRKSAYAKTEGYDPSCPQAEDKDLVQKLEEVTELVFVDAPLYEYRVHASSLAHKDPGIARASHRAVRRRTRRRRLERGIPMSVGQTLLARFEALFR